MLALMMGMALSAAPVGDEILDLSTTESVVAAIQQAGYKAELKKEDDGTPYIVSAANGSPFSVNLYGCDKGNCDSLDITSWYKAEPLFTPAFANEWNRNHRYLSVSVNDKGELVEWVYIDLTGKVTRANFKDQIEWYISLDGSLAKFIDEKRAAAKAGK